MLNLSGQWPLLKASLIVLTVISVIADTMLLPFYPQFFESAFGLDSAAHVGFYVAACCFTVMSAFPFWAKVAKRVQELHLLVYTQIASCVLGVFCYFTTSLVEFWIASQLMLVFKASYLLIYPFVMRLEKKEQHLGITGLFAVLIHFGGIGGALVGGYILNWWSPKDLYLIMPLSDLIQVLLCVYLIIKLGIPLRVDVETVTDTNEKPDAVDRQTDINTPEPENTHSARIFWRLCLVVTLFYFTIYLINPFFTRYWEQISGWDNSLATAFIYAIPAWVALLCLTYHRYRQAKTNDNVAIQIACAVGLLGLFLQGSEQFYLVLLGRCLFGYAAFQFTVRLNVILFSISKPEQYSSDYSKLNIFQNIGVIAASFSAGYLVEHYSFQSTFTVAFFSLLLAFVVFYYLFVRSAENELHEKEKPQDSRLDTGIKPL